VRGGAKGDKELAEETVLPVWQEDETETLSYEEAARQLAEALRSEGGTAGEKTLAAFRRMFMAYALNVWKVASDPELRELLPGCAALCGSDGFAHVLVRSDCLENYLRRGCPVPKGARTTVLHVLGLDAAAEFCYRMRAVAWLVSCGRYDGVWVAGLDENWEDYVILDAGDLVRQVAEAMRKRGGPAAMVRAAAAMAGGPVDMELLREAKDFWRDLREGRVRLG
jgi:hypothetical protein